MNHHRPVRIGLIGLGLRSSLAAHLTTADLPAEVTVLVDPIESRRVAANDRFPDAATVASVGEMIDLGVDAAIVTTPDHTHEELVIELLEAGIPVFVDKPLAITTAGCDRVLETARATNTKIFVGHNMRHMPVITTMRELITDGMIGEVKAVWCRHFVGHGGDFYFKDWHAEQANTTSLLLQKGAHDIDVIHWLAGGSTRRVSAVGDLVVYGDITARGGQGEKTMFDWFDPDQWPPTEQTGLNDVIDNEDISMMTMRLDNGVLASYQQCHFTPDYWRNYTVIGTHGRLENFGDSDGAVVKLWNQRRSGYREDADLVVDVPTESGGHGGADPRLLEEFLAFVTTGAPTKTSPVAAREAVAAGCAAAHSLRHDSEAVEIASMDDALVEYFASGQVAADVAESGPAKR